MNRLEVDSVLRAMGPISTRRWQWSKKPIFAHPGAALDLGMLSMSDLFMTGWKVIAISLRYREGCPAHEATFRLSSGTRRR